MDEIMKYIGIVVVLIFAAYIVSVTGIANISGVTPTPTPVQAATAGIGDNVSVDYTLTVENGSIYDTSLEAVARYAGIYRVGITYHPLTLVLGAHNVIPGFENAVVGMKVGDSKNVSIPPSQAYGEYNSSLISFMPRNYSVARVEVVPISDFLTAFPDFDFSQQNVTVASWTAEILAHDQTSVTLKHSPALGQVIQTPSWPETVVALNETDITLRRDPIAGGEYVILSAAGNPSTVTVLEVNDNYAIVDRNHPLTGQTLNFTITLVSING